MKGGDNMKFKTAVRFLTRNQYKMARHEFNWKYQPPSFIRRWKEAVRVVVKEMK